MCKQMKPTSAVEGLAVHHIALIIVQDSMLRVDAVVLRSIPPADLTTCFMAGPSIARFSFQGEGANQ